MCSPNFLSGWCVREKHSIQFMFNSFFETVIPLKTVCVHLFWPKPVRLHAISLSSMIGWIKYPGLYDEKKREQKQPTLVLSNGNHHHRHNNLHNITSLWYTYNAATFSQVLTHCHWAQVQFICLKTGKIKLHNLASVIGALWKQYPSRS